MQIVLKQYFCKKCTLQNKVTVYHILQLSHSLVGFLCLQELVIRKSQNLPPTENKLDLWLS